MISDDIFQQVRGSDLQRSRNGRDVQKSDIALAPLYSTDIRPMQTCALCKLLLGPATRKPLLPKRFS